MKDENERKEVRDAQFERLQQNIDRTGAGLPKMIGIERPQEIRQRIETEEARKEADAAKQQGVTHVYATTWPSLPAA